MFNVKEYIAKICEKNQELIQEIGHIIWKFAEVSLEEYHSSTYLVHMLEKLGFTIQRGLVGYPTSFIATYEHGIGGPAFGFLCEFDALPGLGNPEGTMNGHGCGHNMFAAGAVGAAASMRTILDEQNLNAKIIVYGCPAEEVYGCKPFYARQGYFDGLCCILGFHPMEFNGILYAQHNAIAERRYHFFGKSSHAGAEPHLGISALDAMEIFHVATNYLREHVTDDVRISYITENGGIRSNIVPAYACTTFSIRAQELENLQTVIKRIDCLAQGISDGWGCQLKIEEGFSYANTIINRPLAEVAYRNLMEVGSPVFTQEERQFVKSLGVKGDLREDIIPLPAELSYYTASTDEGDASWCAPWVRVCTSCLGYGTPGHSYAVTAQSDNSVSLKGTLQTVKIICGTIWDLLRDPRLREKMQEAYLRNVSPLPSQQKWPDVRRFPQSPGVYDDGVTLHIVCDENPLLPRIEGLRILIYKGNQALGESIVQDGQAEIKLKKAILDREKLVLKYVVPGSMNEILLGYYQFEKGI